MNLNLAHFVTTNGTDETIRLCLVCEVHAEIGKADVVVFNRPTTDVMVEGMPIQDVRYGVPFGPAKNLGEWIQPIDTPARVPAQPKRK